MNKLTKMLAAASLTTLAIITGCSDSSEPDPTKAELCAAGVTRDCLMGTWTFNGVKSITSNTFVNGFDFTAAPGYLKFYQDVEKLSTGAKKYTDMFEIDLSPSDINYSNTDCNPIAGEFSVAGTQVTLKMTKGNMCVGSKNMTYTPTITNDGTTITMDIGKVWLTLNQATTTLGQTEANVQSYYTEVFTIGAAQKSE